MSGRISSAGERFDRLFKLGGTTDPAPLYAELRSAEPVFWSDATRAWVLTRYSDVQRLLATEEQFAVLSGEAGATIHGKTILQMRGDEHRKKSALVAKEIRNVKLLRGRIRALVDDVSSRLVSQLRGAPHPVEMRSALSGPLPLNVIASLLGIEQPGLLAGWYRDLALAGVENLIGDENRRERGLEALRRFEALIDPIIEATRVEPGKNLLSSLVTAEYGGSPLPDDEVRTLAGFLLTAGVETTDRTLSSLLFRLGNRPDLWRLLRERHDLIVPAIVETLRIDPPVQGIGRLALADSDFEGVSIGRGERIIGLIASANRDETVFDDPDTFDPARFSRTADRQFTPAGEILSFGAGPHHCTGSLLAKLELSTAMRHLLTSFERVELSPQTPAPTGFMLRSPERLLMHLIPAS